jgi:hypothetical protein
MSKGTYVKNYSGFLSKLVKIKMIFSIMFVPIFYDEYNKDCKCKIKKVFDLDKNFCGFKINLL